MVALNTIIMMEKMRSYLKDLPQQCQVDLMQVRMKIEEASKVYSQYKCFKS